MPANSDNNWKIMAAADFDNDGMADLLWRNSVTGENSIWLMNGTNRISTVALDTVQDLNWMIVGAADFNRDGKLELLWSNPATGESALWYMNGTVHAGGVHAGNRHP